MDDRAQEITSELQELLSSQIEVGKKFSSENRIINENSAGAILKLTQAVATLQSQRPKQQQRE